MPLMRFTKFTEKVRDHTKTYTFREPRVRPLEPGHKLHVYTLEKLGTATIHTIQPTQIKDITDTQAVLDGFENRRQAQQLLMKMHKSDKNKLMNFIGFIPHWTPTKIIRWHK